MYSTARITSLSFIILMRVYLLVVLLSGNTVSFSQSPPRGKTSVAEDSFPAVAVKIKDQLKMFDDSARNATYRIILCADVPYNKDPLKVAHKQQTGHVFLILQKIKYAGDTISSVFGFYPRKGLQAVLFKKVKSSIKDNSRRKHDVAITKELSPAEFDTVLSKAIALADRKYHVNRYNCYDYALLIFNSVAASSPLPFQYIRFPFIFGRGGSPCGVYKDLKALKESGSVWAPAIVFGDLEAPVSHGRRR